MWSFKEMPQMCLRQPHKMIIIKRGETNECETAKRNLLQHLIVRMHLAVSMTIEGWCGFKEHKDTKSQGLIGCGIGRDATNT